MSRRRSCSGVTWCHDVEPTLNLAICIILCPLQNLVKVKHFQRRGNLLWARGGLFHQPVHEGKPYAVLKLDATQVVEVEEANHPDDGRWGILPPLQRRKGLKIWLSPRQLLTWNELWNIWRHFGTFWHPIWMRFNAFKVSRTNQFWMPIITHVTLPPRRWKLLGMPGYNLGWPQKSWASSLPGARARPDIFV